MNVREAIATAKQYTREVFADEKIADLGLEEVVRETNTGFGASRSDSPDLAAWPIDQSPIPWPHSQC